MSSGSVTLPVTGGSGGSGTVTSVSVVTANGVSGSVANPTSTPAITLTISALTTKGDLLTYGTGAVRLPVGTNNQIILADSTQTTGLRYANNLTSTGITIDGAGLVIATGLRGVITVPYNGVITAWTLLADQVGSVVIDVWKTDYAGYPGSVANTIVGSDPPTLTAVQKNRNLTLSAWTSTTITAGDILYFNVNSATTVTRVNLVLTVMKT